MTYNPFIAGHSFDVAVKEGDGDFQLVRRNFLGCPVWEDDNASAIRKDFLHLGTRKEKELNRESVERRERELVRLSKVFTPASMSWFACGTRVHTCLEVK